MQLNDYIDMNRFKLLRNLPSTGSLLYREYLDIKTNEKVILKQVQNFDGSQENIEEKINELTSFLTKFQHPTIIQFLGFTISFENESAFIITEFAMNDSLYDLLKLPILPSTFNNSSRQIILIGVSRAMMLLHKHNILHCDLRSQSILLDLDFHPKLTNIESSILNQQQNGFAAPEVANKNKFSKEFDIFSFGIIMYELLTNLITPIVDGYCPTIPDTVKPAFKKLIERCWSQNKDDRPSFEELFFTFSYDKNFYLDNINECEVTKYVNSVKEDLIFCASCGRNIFPSYLVYYSGFPYHRDCVKCLICNKKYSEGNSNENFICLAQGMFLCREDYNEYLNGKELPQNIENIVRSSLIKNSINDMFNFPVFNNDNISYYKPEDVFIDSDMISNSININKPYENFLPSVTFRFSFPPNKIDYKKLQEILGNDIIVIKVTKGCTFLKVALFASVEFSKIKEKFSQIIDLIKDKLSTALGSIVGNLVNEPEITIPDDKSIEEIYKKNSMNLLQNTKSLEQIELKEIKNEVLKNLQNEKILKNWSQVFQSEQLFQELEEQVRNDVKFNPIELIIVGQTIIANKYYDEYEKIKNKIPFDDRCECFLYHGTRLRNHSKIIREHFLEPNNVDGNNRHDSGYYGIGIYATEDIFYASMYANNTQILNFGEKASVFCCRAIFNTSHCIEMEDLTCDGFEIEDDVKSNYGIHHALVGDPRYWPILDHDIENHFISAEEFVFANKYQIIPLCSFTIMRTNYFILWRDEYLENAENSKYAKELARKLQVNVYFENDLEEALNIIRLKKRNNLKLITNGGLDQSGKKLIEEARKIKGSNFLCLVFAEDKRHLNWVLKMENVLFTDDPEYFKKFAEMNLDKNSIFSLVSELEKEYKVKFKINYKSLHNF